MEIAMPTPSALPEGDRDRDLVLRLMLKAIAQVQFWMRKLGWSAAARRGYWQALADEEAD